MFSRYMSAASDATSKLTQSIKPGGSVRGCLRVSSTKVCFVCRSWNDILGSVQKHASDVKSSVTGGSVDGGKAITAEEMKRLAASYVPPSRQAPPPAPDMSPSSA